MAVLLSHPSCCGKHAAWDAVVRKAGGHIAQGRIGQIQESKRHRC